MNTNQLNKPKYSSYSPFKRPPTAIFKARLDNIAIVPASLLPFKEKWQSIANNLPTGSILICHSETNTIQKQTLEKVAAQWRGKGHAVTNLSTKQLV